jgi:molybdopterin synthase sulfur carrier subunit
MIFVKFFASLREKTGLSEYQLEATQINNVADIWQSIFQEELPKHILIAINCEYTHAQQSVKDNDEVAFFPPVTGG